MSPGPCLVRAAAHARILSGLCFVSIRPPQAPFRLLLNVCKCTDPHVPPTKMISLTVHPAFSLLVNLKPKKTGDSLHANPPLACHTQQYAAQITANIEHKYALWFYHWPSTCSASEASAWVAIMDNDIVSTEPQMGPPWGWVPTYK